MKIILAIGMLLLGAAQPVHAETITGTAHAIDGDTIEVAGQRVRLWGVDAPELAQVCDQRPCGKIARDYLELASGPSATLRCDVVDRDRYARSVARCYANDGRDVGAYLVRQGWAVDYTKYSKGAYLPQQREAEKARAGMWAGKFAMPADYRKGVR